MKTQCTTCDGDGLSARAKLIKDFWYGYREDPSVVIEQVWTSDNKVIRERVMTRLVQDKQHWRGSWVGNTDQDSITINIDPVAIDRYAAIYAVEVSKPFMHNLRQVDVDALLAEDRLMDFTHELKDHQWVKKANYKFPTPQEVNEWSIRSFLGHDHINQHIVVKAICNNENTPHYCPTCNGEGEVV